MRLDADVAALRLHPGAGEEDRADDAEHGDLVLPVGAGLEQVAREHAVGEHERRGQQRDHAEQDRRPVDPGERCFDDAEHPVMDNRADLRRARDVDPVSHNSFCAAARSLAQFSFLSEKSFQMGLASVCHLASVASSRSYTLAPAFW